MRLSLPRLKMPRLRDSVSGLDLHGAKGWVMGSREKIPTA